MLIGISIVGIFYRFEREMINKEFEIEQLKKQINVLNERNEGVTQSLS